MCGLFLLQSMKAALDLVMEILGKNIESISDTMSQPGKLQAVYTWMVKLSYACIFSCTAR